MSKRLIVGDREYLERSDYERLGTYPQAALDGVVGGVIGYPAHWAAFTVSQKSAQEVVVSPGKYFDGEIVYSSSDAQTLNLTLYLPLAPSDERWVGLILRGEVDTINEERAFETSEDPELSVPVAMSTPKTEVRDVRIAVQQGLASPAPALFPTVAETDGCIAFVRLTTGGIQEIVPGEQWRAKTLFEVEGRVTSIELRVHQLFEDTETIRTDVANLAASIKQVPDPRLFNQIVRDTARTLQALNMPEEARNYWFNQGLVKDDWDFTQGGFFRIADGVRFQYVSQRDHTLRILDAGMAGISLFDNRRLLPAYEEVTRITSPEGKGVRDIASAVHTVTTAQRHTQTHQRIRYGETITVCENMAGWEDAALAKRRAGETIKHAGEEWVHKGQTANPWNDDPGSNGGHKEIALQRVIKESYTSTYTTYNTELFGLNGAIHGQTFLCSQVMVATSIDLNFTKVDAVSGDVTLCLSGVDASGAPDYDAVIAKISIPRTALSKGWNKFSFEPTLLEQGRRYAWFVVSTGNHQLMMNSGNAFSGGTAFMSTDGAWSQGAPTEDFSFRLNAARFLSSRTVVPFEALTLDGGMTEIEMIYQAWEPAATAIVWEVKPQGETAWTPMDAREDNPLANLPPLVQIRAVLVGTEDVAPSINLTPYARAIAGRMRNDMRAITALIPFGFATDQAQVVLNFDFFDPARHTGAAKLVLADNTVVEPSAFRWEKDPTKATRHKLIADYTGLPGTTQAARLRIEATTDSVIHIPFVQDCQLNAF